MTDDITARFYPETGVGGFTRCDGTIEFFTRVAALLEPGHHVLDFGAGRGGHVLTDASPYRRKLRNLEGRCAKLVGCDVDPAVIDNPFTDENHVIETDGPLPFDDDSFDLVVSNFVFEHVAYAQNTASELLRVTRPGGYICAMTPNKYSYIALASMLVRNRSHGKVLSRVQPDREEIDVFPTVYKMNTISALRKLFGQASEICIYRFTPEPAYHMNRALVFRFLLFMHKHMPEMFSTNLMIFVRK